MGKLILKLLFVLILVSVSVYIYWVGTPQVYEINDYFFTNIQSDDNEIKINCSAIGSMQSLTDYKIETFEDALYITMYGGFKFDITNQIYVVINRSDYPSIQKIVLKDKTSSMEIWNLEKGNYDSLNGYENE